MSTENLADRDVTKVVFVCPAIQRTSPNDVIPASVADGVSSLLDAKNAVISFTNPRLLECFVKYPDLFDLEPIVILGYPDAVYDAVFEKLTWELDRITYDELLSDVTSAKRAADITASDGGSRPPKPHDKKLDDAGVRPHHEEPDYGVLVPKTRDFSRFGVAAGTSSAIRDGGDAENSTL